MNKILEKHFDSPEESEVSGQLPEFKPIHKDGQDKLSAEEYLSASASSSETDRISAEESGPAADHSSLEATSSENDAQSADRAPEPSSADSSFPGKEAPSRQSEKVGLVLEGGAMRGMYTAGVLDVLMENDIKMDGVIGVSAGALFGVNYLSGQKRRALRYNKRFNKDKAYLGLIPLIREGNILSTDYAFNKVPRHLDVFDNEAFMKSGVPFYAVMTNAKTGEAEYKRIDNVYEQMDFLRASGSMPFVSRPVELQGKTYLDGGISDSIPYKWMNRKGFHKLVVVLTRDESYRKKPMNSALVHLKYGRHTPLARRLENRHAEYNQSVEELKEWEKEGKAFVLRPTSPIEIGKLEDDPEQLQLVYDLGRKDALNNLEALKAFLEQ